MEVAFPHDRRGERTPVAADFDHALWERLKLFRIDPPGAELPFLARLARENPGMGLEGAQELWTEYLRFLYLALRAGHAVTPSAGVDAVWHLHLAYTRSYWLELCPRVLGETLHHGPTLGGAGEARRYQEQYLETLRSYERCFGHPAPADHWPAAERRFAERPVTVDGGRHWILRRSTGWSLAAGLVLAGLGLGALLG